MYVVWVCHSPRVATEDSFPELELLFHQVGPRDLTQVIRQQMPFPSEPIGQHLLFNFKIKELDFCGFAIKVL